MAKKDFQIEFPQIKEGEQFADTTPFIYRSEIQGEGMTWRDAKKAMRKWYLDQANLLRGFTEKHFAANEKAFLDAMNAEPVVGQVESGAVSSTSA